MPASSLRTQRILQVLLSQGWCCTGTGVLTLLNLIEPRSCWSSMLVFVLCHRNNEGAGLQSLISCNWRKQAAKAVAERIALPRLSS